MTKSNMHRMEFHQQQLIKHCRICGKRLCKLKSQAPVFVCAKFPNDLLFPNAHPSSFCNPCYALLRRAEKARTSGLPYTYATKTMDWTGHNDNGCLVSSYEQTKALT